MRTLMLLCAALALMWVLPLPSRGQAAAGENTPVTFVDLIGGKTLPLSLKLKELNGEWRRFTTSGAANSMETFFMLAATNGQGLPGPSVFYTKGQTVTLNTETFLIAYQQEAKPFDLQQVMERHELPQPQPLTPETTLNLALLNLRNAGNILDIRPFKLEDELAAGKEQRTVIDRAREKALQAQSMNNLRQCCIAALSYAQDNDEVLPLLDDIEQLQQDVGLPGDVWKHPLTGEPYVANLKMSNVPLGEIENPAVAVIFYEGTTWADGSRCVAFLDGHIEKVSAARWDEIKGQAGLP
ncbi:MAG: hypothetical protein ACYC6A_17130 [Armatimonadota bacterium]